MRQIRRVSIGLIGLACLFGIQYECFAQWIWTPQTRRFLNLDKLPKETAELQLEYARGLLLQGEHKKAYRETEKFVEFYGDSEFADENQFLRGEIRMAQRKLLDAANEFQLVVASYPETDRYDDVIAKQYAIADLYYDEGVARQDDRWRLFRNRPFRRAITVYTMVIDNQPFTEAAAEAQYKVGLCHFTRKEYIEAAIEYRRVIEDYSASAWLDEASYGLAETYYLSSLPPEYDQTPSQLTIEAIDEFHDRYPNDERNAELTAKRREMRENIGTQRLQTARFYERRRSFDAARLSYEVVVEQFADTEAGKAAQTWLDEHPETGR